MTSVDHDSADEAIALRAAIVTAGRLRMGVVVLAATCVWSVAAVFGADDPRRRAEKPLATLPKAVPAPTDNPTTDAKAKLGKVLFFDPRLSGDNSLSCATCHVPGKGLSDGLALAKGHGGKSLSRNSPTLLNVAYLPALFWDGRAKSLEEQALLPIESRDEMHQDLTALEAELNAVGEYAAQFQRVFGTKVTRRGIAQALAAFERTLVTKPAPLDRYLAGDQRALSDAAQRGMELFVGDAGCVRCHRGPLLTDGQYYRLGVSLQDAGRSAVTRRKEDHAKFRTPPLRNVAQTAPYMHDGSLNTLDDVVSFYYRGAPTATTAALPLDVSPLAGRSFSEIPDLVAFLEALTGEPPKIEPPKLP